MLSDMEIKNKYAGLLPVRHIPVGQILEWIDIERNPVECEKDNQYFQIIWDSFRKFIVNLAHEEHKIVSSEKWLEGDRLLSRKENMLWDIRYVSRVTPLLDNPKKEAVILRNFNSHVFKKEELHELGFVNIDAEHRRLLNLGSRFPFDAQGFCDDMYKAPKDGQVLGYKKFILKDGSVYEHYAVCSYTKMKSSTLAQLRQVKSDYVPETWVGFAGGLRNTFKLIKETDQVLEPTHWKYLVPPMEKESKNVKSNV